MRKTFATLLANVVLAMSVAASPCNVPKPSQQCCPCCPAAHMTPQGKLGVRPAQMHIRMAVQAKRPLLSAAILPDETNSPQLCEGDSCNRANAFARSVVTVDSAQVFSASLPTSVPSCRPEVSVLSPQAINQLPPTAATPELRSIALRI
jgi:hypothetical protein